MTTYELSWEPLSPVVRLTHSGTQHDYAKTTATPDSGYFDISAAWYNHPEPYTSQPLNPLSPPSQHKVPEEQESNPLEQEASPLGQSSSSLEQDSNPLEQEASPLGQSSSYLEQDSNPSEQELHHIHDKGTDFYAHTLASLVTPLEQDYNLNEQLSDPFDPDIHAINEASPTDDPSYQTPAARHCRAQRAETHLRFGTARVSPAKIGPRRRTMPDESQAPRNF